jgi:hypothetical protein
MNCRFLIQNLTFIIHNFFNSSCRVYSAGSTNNKAEPCKSWIINGLVGESRDFLLLNYEFLKE